MEVLILITALAATGWSATRLLSDFRTSRAHSLVPMQADPRSEGRKPASIPQALTDLALDCTPVAEDAPADSYDVMARKVRLNGFFCGSTGGEKPARTAIINQTARFRAALFTDDVSPTFSTDYIPLVKGPNEVKIEFTYADGSAFSRTLTVNHL